MTILFKICLMLHRIRKNPVRWLVLGLKYLWDYESGQSQWDQICPAKKARKTEQEENQWLNLVPDNVVFSPMCYICESWNMQWEDKTKLRTSNFWVQVKLNCSLSTWGNIQLQKKTCLLRNTGFSLNLKALVYGFLKRNLHSLLRLLLQ